MREKLAFTASFWGNSAVVCHATEDRPGPVVNQEFGRFETWTQASTFAAGLNAGLDLDSAEVAQIVTSAFLRSNALLNSVSSIACTCAGHAAQAPSISPRTQFVLAELALAKTFCSILRSCPQSTQADRLQLNARNALFDALHFVLYSDLCPCCLEKLTAGIITVHAALQETRSPRRIP
jgi:hypothetical protein